MREKFYRDERIPNAGNIARQDLSKTNIHFRGISRLIPRTHMVNIATYNLQLLYSSTLMHLRGIRRDSKEQHAQLVSRKGLAYVEYLLPPPAGENADVCRESRAEHG